MEGPFLTFLKSSEECRRHLQGRGAEGKRVVCVFPQSVEFEKSNITFKLVSKSHFSVLEQVKGWLSLLRPGMLLVVALPFLTLLVHGYFLKKDIHVDVLVYTALSLVCLHGCAMLFNEYSDHVRGKEISSLYSRKSALSTGVVPGFWAFRVAVGLAFGALAFSFPLFSMVGSELIYVALGVTVSVLGYSLFGRGLKSYGLGELAVFTAFGPLLVYGLSLALFQSVGEMELVYGALLGYFSVLYIQLRNFQSIMRDDLHSVGTFISRLGFDRSKRFLQFNFLLGLFLIWCFNFYYLPDYKSMHWIVGVGFGLIYSGIGYWCVQKLEKIHSPLSSSLESLKGLVFGLQGITHFSFLFLSFVLFGFMSRVPFITKLEILGGINKFLKWFN